MISAMRLCLLTLALLLATLTEAGESHAQETNDENIPQVKLVTFGPGSAIFERFSHNAIWIHDPSEPGRYQDVAFNYGIFAFGGDFIPRFIRGTMRYWMDGEYAPAMLDAYASHGRSVWMQTLNIDPGKTRILKAFLWNNAKPENRYYTYNYYTDNCSTRVRDALDLAVGGEIRRQTSERLTGRTYRHHTLRIMAENPLLFIGTDYLLGQRSDRELSEWEEMFMPRYMMRHLGHVTVDGRPIIASEHTYAEGTLPPVRETPPRWIHWFVLVGILMAALLLACDRFSRRRFARIGRDLLLTFWLALASVAGVILSFMTLFTDHVAVRSNENFLQLSPIALACLILLPWALKRHGDGQLKCPRVAQTVANIALLMALLSVIGLAIKALPAFYQDNWRIISLALPMNIAVAMIFVRLARRRETQGETETT